MGVFNEQVNNTYGKGIQGAPGIGFNLTADGNYDIINRKLTNVGTPTANADAATKKYVDDNSSSSTSDLTVDSNIDMKNNYRIINLKHPVDADEPATKQYSDSKFLDRDGSRTMLGNLSMNNNKIIKVGTPTVNDDAVTKEYTDNTFLPKSGGLMTGNLDMNRQYRIFNLPTPNGDRQPVNLATANFLYLPRNGSKVMLNNLNMDNKLINNLGTPRANSDAATKKYVDDNSGSPDLSDYLEKDGTIAMTGNLNLNSNKIIKLSTPTVNDDAATKKYVDDNVPDLSGYLKKDGTVAMTSALNMNSKKINNLATPTSNNDAVNKSYADHLVHHTAIQPSHYTDQFAYLMSSAAQWTDESNGGNSFIINKIDNLPPSSGNPHSYNHRVIYYSINKNSQGGYKYKMGMNFYTLPVNKDYTLCLELFTTEYILWHKSQITVDKGSSTGLKLNLVNIKKLSHRYAVSNIQTRFIYYHKLIINFKKLALPGRAFLYVTVNIPQSGIDLNTYPSQFKGNYLVAYGITGAFINIDPDKVYDYHKSFVIKPTEVTYNVAINMQNLPILNFNTDDGSGDNIARVSDINAIKPFIKFYIYRKYFNEFYDFSDAKCYNLVTSASGVVFNSIGSTSGNAARNITFPNKTIDNINNGSLTIDSYVLKLEPSLNVKSFTICLVFKIWPNRNWNFDKYDVRVNNGVANRNSLIKVYYQNSDKKIYLNVNNTIRSLTIPNSFFTKNIVLWITQNNSPPVTKVNISNYSAELIINAASYVDKQRFDFFNSSTEIYRYMYTPTFYDTHSLQHHTILLEEKLKGNYVD